MGNLHIKQELKTDCFQCRYLPGFNGMLYNFNNNRHICLLTLLIFRVEIIRKFPSHRMNRHTSGGRVTDSLVYHAQVTLQTPRLLVTLLSTKNESKWDLSCAI